MDELAVGLRRLEAEVVLEHDEPELLDAHRLLARIVEALPGSVDGVGRQVAARDALLGCAAAARQQRAHGVQITDESGERGDMDGLVGEQPERLEMEDEAVRDLHRQQAG